MKRHKTVINAIFLETCALGSQQGSMHGIRGKKQVFDFSCSLNDSSITSGTQGPEKMVIYFSGLNKIFRRKKLTPSAQYRVKPINITDNLTKYLYIFFSVTPKVMIRYSNAFTNPGAYYHIIWTMINS